MYRYDIQSPSLLLVDNFECHVSKKSEEMLANELFSELCPLPPNTTSVCQPLDVGVMGPFKAKMRKHWLSESFVAKTAKEKRLATINRTIQAWDEISVIVIKKSFQKAIPRPDFVEVEI